ncbi:MAG TPA: sigma-70 family RNA polymerase sigma factor [Aliiroseovarius sp.]|nr:sigma-70 family RNA polymerase sigma factor [Aliiroseovarius sp.]
MTISYAAARNAPLLEYEYERRLIREWQEKRDRDALEALIMAHARLVFQLARKLSRKDTDQEEMIAEGLLGLIKAADVFDLSRETRFSTYARWWVRNSVIGAYGRLSSVVDAPASARREAAGAQEAQTRFERLASADGDELERVECPDPTPEEHAITQSHRGRLRANLAQAIGDLGEIEREIVVERNLRADPTSIEDLSARLGISRERLRQVERRAISKLKFELLSRGISTAQVC